MVIRLSQFKIYLGFALYVGILLNLYLYILLVLAEQTKMPWSFVWALSLALVLDLMIGLVLNSNIQSINLSNYLTKLAPPAPFNKP